MGRVSFIFASGIRLGFYLSVQVCECVCEWESQDAFRARSNGDDDTDQRAERMPAMDDGGMDGRRQHDGSLDKGQKNCIADCQGEADDGSRRSRFLFLSVSIF